MTSGCRTVVILQVWILLVSISVSATDQPVQRGAGSGGDGPRIPDSKEILSSAQKHLLKEFDLWLEKPAIYRKKALKECSIFPEGELYPFMIPALGYVNLALRGDIKKDHAAKQVRTLLDQGIPVVAASIRAPGGDITRMNGYHKQATFLATLNLGLANYELVSDDGRYKALHDHISKLLMEALRKKKGGTIDSYPEYSWSFDTIIALASLSLWEKKRGENVTHDLLKAHLRWRELHETNRSTGLPMAYGRGPSRGCDLSMQICLLAQMDMEETKALYQNYVKAHWLDRGFAAGFADWPKGYKKAPAAGDIDSGPVFMGIGCTASGVGLGTTQAVGDKKRLDRLCQQLYLVSSSVRAGLGGKQQNNMPGWISVGLETNPKYYTGFLFGDCVLFYAVTWTPYSEASDSE